MVKISQSLIKAFYDYKQGITCGLVFKAKYIDKDPKAQHNPSDAMQEGIYFEYIATGSLPKSGIVPVAEKKNAGTAKEALTAPYERAQKAAMLFKRTIRHYKIKIISTGEYLASNDKDGVLDIRAEWNGEPCIIDLKYSGLIDDKWSEFGWDIESLPQKDTIMIQGVHYKILAKEVLGIEDIPFYYFVFNSKDPNDMRIIKQTVDESRIASHYVVVDNTKRGIETEMRKGFKPLPSLKNCSQCPLKDGCKYEAKVANIIEVFY